MRLTQLRLENYRCFGDMTVDLHPQMTVLIAPNGAGKTTLLDAARVALWPFVKGFDLGSATGKAAPIDISDVRLSQQPNGNMEAQTPCRISATGTWGDEATPQTWTQRRERVQPRTNTLEDAATKRLTAWASGLQQQVREGAQPVTLPLVSYLGTSRLWFQGRFTAVAAGLTLDKTDYSRTSGYLNCLSQTSSYKSFEAWFRWVFLSYREGQLEALERGTPPDETSQRFAQTIQVLQTAVDALVKEATGWHGLEFSQRHFQQLVMHHPSQGVMPVELLSDGLRNAIAMVADLAFRACKLNPHLGAEAAMRTPGVVLVDEVDMFLHPAWQQTILRSLAQAFPRLQFIVTTHSPQVLSTVRRENIRVLGRGQAEIPLADPYAEPSGDVMHSVMAVDPLPPVREKRLLDRLTEWVDAGHYRTPRAARLFRVLNARLGNNHPQLLVLQRNIRRMEALRR